MKSIAKRCALAACLLVAFLVAGPVWADRVAEVQIFHLDTVDHRTGRVSEIENGTNPKPEGFKLATNPTIDVTKGNKVFASIEGANPLLFKYTIKKGTAV